MSNNYMYAIDRSDEYLAHYGIKGMKWGVRKAVESGNARALNRHFMKSQRKLARLRKHAANKEKYARRAKMLGAGALATGGLTVGGIGGISGAMNMIGGAGKTAINAVVKPRLRRNLGESFYNKMNSGANKLTEWGNQHGLRDTADKIAQKRLADEYHAIFDEKNIPKGESNLVRITEWGHAKDRADKIRKVGDLTNDQLFRAGTSLATAGLAAGAGYNAYRAATADRAAKKAREWERAMKDTFGTTGMSNKKARSKRNKRR